MFSSKGHISAYQLADSCIKFALGFVTRAALGMNRRDNSERRGSEVKGDESVGKYEHTAEGKKDGEICRIRRAKFDDLNAIMDINDNIYDGLDYMPALFYTFMHSKLHAIYVHEEDGKIVGLSKFIV